MQSVTLYLNKTDELLPQQSRFRRLRLATLARIKAARETACLQNVSPERAGLEFFRDCRVTSGFRCEAARGGLHVDWPSLEETSNQNRGVSSWEACRLMSEVFDDDNYSVFL